MGISQSPKACNEFVRGVCSIFSFCLPSVLSSIDGVSHICSYMDNICGGDPSISVSWIQFSSSQIFGHFLGVDFKVSKALPPESEYPVIGLRMNAQNDLIDFKANKREKVIGRIDELLQSDAWSLKDLQKISGD